MAVLSYVDHISYSVTDFRFPWWFSIKVVPVLGVGTT
jgi:hypothetical protein